MVIKKRNAPLYGSAFPVESLLLNSSLSDRSYMAYLRFTHLKNDGRIATTMMTRIT